MNRRVILSIFAFMLLVSCQLNSSKLDVKKPKANFETKLLGKWTIHYTGVMCNVCPDVYFRSDSLASVTMGTLKREQVNWKLLNDSQIRISKSSTFPDSIYKISFHTENKQLEMELSTLTGTHLFTLMKY